MKSVGAVSCLSSRVLDFGSYKSKSVLDSILLTWRRNELWIGLSSPDLFLQEKQIILFSHMCDPEATALRINMSYILKSKGTFWKSRCGLAGERSICAFRPIFIFACLIYFKHVSEGNILKSFISKSHYFLFKFWHVLHTCTMRVTACEPLVQERAFSKKIK